LISSAYAIEEARRNLAIDRPGALNRLTRFMEALATADAPQALKLPKNVRLDPKDQPILFARNTAALWAACAAFAPGKSLKDCVAKEQADKPPEGTLVAARAQLARLREFIEDKHIASIPGNEQALVAEAPPYNRANFAYIVIAGPYEKNLPSVTTSHPRIRHGRKPSKRSTSLGGPNS
jgi:hypothetical protein